MAPIQRGIHPALKRGSDRHQAPLSLLAVQPVRWLRAGLSALWAAHPGRDSPLAASVPAVAPDRPLVAARSAARAVQSAALGPPLAEPRRQPAMPSRPVAVQAAAAVRSDRDWP